MVLPPCIVRIFQKIGDSCVGAIVGYFKTEVGHLLEYSANIEKLREEDVNMRDARTFVDRKVTEASSQGETQLDPRVETWQRRLTANQEKASGIIRDEEKVTERCLMGLRPNLLACYRASKRAIEAIDKGVELRMEVEDFGTVANVDHSKCLGVITNPDFEELESRKQVSERIMAALKDPSVKMVGMYGMGGQGKTTLAKNVGEQLYRDGTFNFVVMTTVTQNPDFKKIQQQIADQLRIKLHAQTEEGRASQLMESLGTKDKILIIVDDIWRPIALQVDVGIPIAIGKELRILMTSRDKNVLNKMDSTTRNFPLDSLPHDDAWNLFERMAGDLTTVCQDSNCHSIARQVVELCGGIPILLVTIARALRNCDLGTWNDALTQLKGFDKDDLVEDAYKKIEVSYNFLNGEEVKRLFLLCAQLDHHSIPIDDLLKYTMGLGLFKERRKLKDVRDKLHKYLHDLKGCCLLQDNIIEGTVKMHDVVHKFAAYVGSRDHQMFTVAEDHELEEWPDKDKLEQFTTISFLYCHHQLPAAFDNSKLESFIMFRNKRDAPLEVPGNFFKGMTGLKLMVLTRMSLSPVLPASFGALVKLRTLRLDFCKLVDITMIGELPMLQVLSLVGSTIARLPEEIGKLTLLKLLDLCFCEHLKVLAPGVLSKLTLLEDLRVIGSFCIWNQCSLGELKNLGNLINLGIMIRDPKTSLKDFVFEKLETFTISIGEQLFFIDYQTTSRTLNLELDTGGVQLDEGIKAMMRKAENLSLSRLEGFESLYEILHGQGFPQLKHLNVERKVKIQYIVKMSYNNHIVFPMLESLKLLDLEKLERICDADHLLPVGSFRNLRTIYVTSCDALKCLFSSHLAKGLLSLKEIGVYGCKSMENIFSRDEGILLPQVGSLRNLTTIEVSSCDALKCLFSSHLAKGLLSLKKIYVYRCKSMENIFSRDEGIMGFTDEIEAQHIVKGSYNNCDDDHLLPPVRSLRNLTTIKVSFCAALKCLFSSHLAKGLLSLKEIEVSGCESMENIVSRKNENEEMIIGFTDQLRALTLRELPRLKSFNSNSTTPNNPINSSPVVRTRQEQELAYSNENEIVEENDQEQLTSPSPTSPNPLFNEKVVFPKLEKLKLVAITVEKIWDDQLEINQACWLQNLTNLKVKRCHNLSYLFTSSIVKSLAQLKKIAVEDCSSIEKIVATEGGEMAGDHTLILFPKLDCLVLANLSQLKTFCHANFIECPTLRELHITNCCELKTFMITTNAPGARTEANSSTLFDENVAFPNLKDLQIRATGSGLVNVFSPNICRRLLNLEILKISRCHSLEKVFDVQMPFITNEKETSTMHDMSFLGLPQLKELEIKNCENMKEIVSWNEKEEEEEEEEDRVRLKKFVFPKMTSLILEDLPKLERFYPGPHILDGPNMNMIELKMVGCDKMDPFCLKNILTFAKIIDNSKILTLASTSVQATYSGRQSGELEVHGAGSQVFPFAFLERFQKFEEVELSGFSIMQLFPCEPACLGADDNDIDIQAKALARIQQLELRSLPEMKRIWSTEHSQLGWIPTNLKSLRVCDCDSLMSLAPPTALFQNLTYLHVWTCKGLIKLVVSSSTAKSLVNLTELKVNDCDSLTKIVAIDDDHGEEGSKEDIVFDKLKTLTLEFLSSLTSFCSTTNCNFHFPSLDRVIVVACPEMEFFSKGALSTPKLSMVRITLRGEEESHWEGETHWEGDLDSTIRHLYKEMVGYYTMERLKRKISGVKRHMA